MQTILSTKMLSPAQKNLLLNAGIGLVEYNAIKIESLDFRCEDIIQNAIITSRNTAKAIIRRNIQIDNVFCVGEKTASLLNENGYNLLETADYGKELAVKLLENYRERVYTFFCGDKRMDDIPLSLKKNNINFREIEVYRTHLDPKAFDQEFDGILFFSPSAVQSYIMKNETSSSVAFCIGTTTAAEAKKYTDNIIIATRPSIENVLVQVVKKFKV
ncbi:uroporphyrinogen-III synthase [Antarcticibacterium arcticum]|uniref:Uroporphyrinogen-III synthase n=1 Tax=Antarcticibacterium arcticum TaxID=2585771 RepID=A0A5B8YKX7_9FLAO|nr:uroporphyrinogen-III synthase [Antarcticibacterium arcticum]QED38355.1 uroporphyrinogen-III synthase [Antarcticibacterium arcticum]